MRKNEMIERIRKLECSTDLYVRKGFPFCNLEYIPIKVVVASILDHLNLEIKHSPESTKLQTIKKAK